MTYRKLALTSLLCLSVMATCAITAGCPSPNADAIAINGAGAICAIVLTNDGDPDAPKCTTIASQIATAITNLVPGSDASNIVQLGDSLVAIIQADTNSKAADEIAIILGTILNIVGEYEPTDVVGIATANAVHAAAAGQVPVNTTNAPRTKAQLYAAYNAALAAHPVPGLKRLK